MHSILNILGIPNVDICCKQVSCHSWVYLTRQYSGGHHTSYYPTNFVWIASQDNVLVSTSLCPYRGEIFLPPSEVGQTFLSTILCLPLHHIFPAHLGAGSILLELLNGNVVFIASLFPLCIQVGTGSL